MGKEGKEVAVEVNVVCHKCNKYMLGYATDFGLEYICEYCKTKVRVEHGERKELEDPIEYSYIPYSGMIQ